MTFTPIDQGLLFFYILLGILGILGTLLYIANK
jgi:hypothetical protein